MSVPAVVFMVLTMGGVIGLNVLCLTTWLRGPKAPLGADDARADDPGPDQGAQSEPADA